MARFLFCFLVVFFCYTFLQSYTTEDGKFVPPLDPPSGPVVTATNLGEFLFATHAGLQPGVTAMIADGTYDISGIEPIEISKDNVTIRGASGDPTKVIIRGLGFESCVNTDEDMFVLNGSNITIADVTIMESRCHGIKLGLVDNLLLHNVRFINIGERKIKGPSSNPKTNVEIRYCHMEDNKVPASNRCDAHANGDYIAGMDVMEADTWNIHDCLFKNIRGASGSARGAIFLWRGCKDIITQRCSFIGCDRGVAYGNPSGTNDITNGTIRNCFFVAGASQAIEICHSSNIKIYNNTIYSANSSYGRTIDGGSAGNGEIKNNIIMGQIRGTFTQTNNLSSASANWFVNPYQGDLHLKSTATQAINHGVSATGVTEDWDGHSRSGTIDIGADEYNSQPSDNRIYFTGGGSVQTLLGRLQPNPFNSGTRIVYQIAPESLARNIMICVYDGSGKKIRTFSSQPHGSGNHSLFWDGRNDYGNPVSSGYYVFRMSAGGEESTTRGFLVR